MTDDSIGLGDRVPSVAESIAEAERQLAALEAAGGDEATIVSLRRELRALRELPAGAQLFLRGSGDDSVILGFNVPSERRPSASDPEGAA